MSTQKVDFTEAASEGVTWTLLVTLYLRAYDSRQEHPVLGDHYAAEAVERINYDFDRLARWMLPQANQYLVALRARGLDDWSRAFLAAHPDATVLQLGCGLDSRMLRLDPDGELNWYDVDMPKVIELRREIYPERGRYRMIPASVTDEGWLDAVPADKPVLVIAEGLLPYLTNDQVRRLLERIAGHFGTGELIFDGLSRWAIAGHPLFHWSPGDGRAIERENPRLTLAETVSFAEDYRLISAPVVRGVYRFLRALPGPLGRDMYRLFRYTIG